MISSLLGKALRTLVDIARLAERLNKHSQSRAWNLDIKRREPGILFISLPIVSLFKVSKGAKVRNRYNQVPHLTQDTNGKVINLQLDTTNESQEVRPFPAGD